MIALRMEVTKRDDEDYELLFEDIDGNPIDITGCTVFFAAKIERTDTDDNAVITKEITEFTYPEDGLATLSLTKTDTNIDIGSYYFDIQLKNADGEITSSQRGKLIVYQDINIRTDIDLS